MHKRIAVTGCNTKSAFDLSTTRERLTFDLSKGLLEDLNIDRDAVDTTILVSNDFLDGRTISNVFIDPAAGVYMKDESKVEMDGLNALIYGCMRILSGQYQTVLLVALSLCGHQVSPYLHIEYSLDVTYDRQLNLLNELSAAALQARGYLSRFGYTAELLDRIAARNLANASLDPNQARRIPGISRKQVAGSSYLYEPLRELHCYPPTDGGCAVLLASEEKAAELTDKPVWIEGMGSSIDTYYIGERDLSTSRSAAQAARRAYDMAGVKNAAKEVSFAEISSLFAHQEPLLAECLGLMEEGAADRIYGDGENAAGDGLPVNPSGGPLGAHPISATGLLRLAEAVRQLRGEAGENQVEKAKLAVVHGQDGLCAQQNAVVVLGI